MKSLLNGVVYLLKPVVCIVLCALLLTTALADKDRLGNLLSPAALAVVGAAEPEKYARAVLSEMNSDKENTDKSDKTSVLDLIASGTGTDKQDGAEHESVAYVSEDISKIMEESTDLYKSLKKSGTIVEEDLGTRKADTVSGAVKVNDCVDGKSVDIGAELSETLKLKDFNKSKPCVLIFHTHTTEGYELLDTGWFSKDFNSRTKNASKNIVRVGDELTKALTAAGFTVIHDTTIHDTMYSGSYDRSAVTVQKWLDKYPSILLSIDVHRDAIHYSDTEHSKPTAVIEGKKAAQVMIIAGCESGDVTDFPNWKDNLTFSCKLQKTAQELYPGFMRPIFFCTRKYNMNMTRYGTLLEFGTDSNTLDEAVYAGRLMGNALAKTLDDEIKNANS